MLALPFVFVVNALIFMIILEERFKVITTLVITAAAVGISFAVSMLVSNNVTTPFSPEIVSVAINAGCLFIASIFISSNNIAHKLFVGILLITDYAFFGDLITIFFKYVPVDTAGVLGMVIASLIYALASLLVFSIFVKPLRYTYRRMVSPYSIGLCVFQALALCCAYGALCTYTGTDSLSLRFFPTLIIEIIVAFAARSNYGAARFKSRDIERLAENEINEIRADSFNAMVVNVESYKATKKNVTYAMSKLGSLAEQGRTQEIVSYVAKFNDNPGSSPLLETYSENPYINAVVATKAAEAASKGIRIESNISLGESHVRVIDLCILIDDVLNWAVRDAQTSEADERFVRINVLPSKGQLSIETVHTTGVSDMKNRITKRTFGSFLQEAFELKDNSPSELKNVREIAAKHSGRISIAEGDGTTIARIGINY